MFVLFFVRYWQENNYRDFISLRFTWMVFSGDNWSPLCQNSFRRGSLRHPFFGVWHKWVVKIFSFIYICFLSKNHEQKCINWAFYCLNKDKNYFSFCTALIFNWVLFYMKHYIEVFRAFPGLLQLFSFLKSYFIRRHLLSSTTLGSAHASPQSDNDTDRGGSGWVRPQSRLAVHLIIMCQTSGC